MGCHEVKRGEVKVKVNRGDVKLVELRCVEGMPRLDGGDGRR